MESSIGRDQRVMWAFWIAAALAAIAAVAPILFSVGFHTRLAGAIIPFGIAALALALNGSLHARGRSLAVVIYFVAGIAIVYGVLEMVSLPLRLAVVGTCPPAPDACPAGYEQPMTSGEDTGLGVAAFCGALAILVGFVGLLLLYRKHRTAARSQPAAWPAQPPPAVTAAPPAAEAVQAETVQKVEELKELPAPVEPKELPPPA
ncbi:MAG TPA: hypothetical protein VF383_10750 [Candidatus Dormibacteraeota bacterium]